MKIYFAHPINTYGDQIEKYAIDAIHRLYPNCTILNPNTIENQICYQKYGMDFFKELVLMCDRVIVLPFSDGSIGAGISKEVQWAINAGIKVILLHPFNSIEEIFDLKSHRVLTVDETRSVLQGQ